MSTYSVVLYFHVFFLLVGTGAGTLIGVCLFRLRAAQTVAEAGPWATLAGQSERIFPFVLIGLFGTGAYLTSDLWTWNTGWIDVSIVALVLLGGQGGGVASRRAHVLKQALQANGPGPLGAEARRLTLDRALWVASFSNPGLVLGVVWDMTQKPGTGTAIAAVVVGYAVGAAIAVRFSQAPAASA